MVFALEAFERQYYQGKQLTLEQVQLKEHTLMR